jgi:ribonucleotide reductase alpha subunit
MKLRIPFISPEAERLDLEIFETIYHAALEASCELAQEEGLGTYHKFEGSPYSQGVLRMDMWIENQERMLEHSNNGLLAVMNQYGFTRGCQRVLSGRYDWTKMREQVSKGIRNSLLVALMPTVTTSILMGNNESFEPIPANLYTKSILAGKFTETNNYMIEHLIEIGLWNVAMKNRIIMNNGSLEGIEEIPREVRDIYRTVWDMKQTAIMRRAALRHVFVDQAQSLNIHLADNSNANLRGVLNVGWELGNCTGSYYIRTTPQTDPLKNNLAEVKSADKWTVLSTAGATCDSCGA